MMKLNTKTIKFTVKEHDIQSSSFFCFFSFKSLSSKSEILKAVAIINTTRTFLDFIQNQQKKTQKNLTQQTKTGEKK